MPELSRFYGIVVSMYPEAGERHSTPHFHVRYGEYRATLSIAAGEILAGTLPRAQLRLAQRWGELRRSELETDWQLLVTGQSPAKIAPLE
ncbi:MAG: DUF4160 domain-containing protein [Caldilineaceae bacterium]